MKLIAKKTKHFSMFVMELIFGMVMTLGLVVVLPLSLLFLDITLFANLTFTVVILAIMLIFGLIAFFGFIRPYFIYRKMPEVQAETDGEYLYIHSNKEAKIPLAEMENTYVEADIPSLVTNQFFIHLLSERYGNVIIEVPNYGTYKLYYVAYAEEVSRTIVKIIEDKINWHKQLPSKL